jgi:RNA polymerase sigma factor (sigma-70 family)
MSDIISEIKKKNSDSVSLLYNRYGKKLYGYAVAKWKLSEDETWDVIYKTLYKVISVADTYAFESEDKFAGFVFKIFINYLRNHYRDSKNKHPETVELNEAYNNQLTGKDEKDDPTKSSPLMNCLQKVLQSLEDWQRILLLMRAQDYPYESIAAYVNKPGDQLKVYYMRLKKIVTDKTNECVDNHSK